MLMQFLYLRAGSFVLLFLAVSSMNFILCLLFASTAYTPQTVMKYSMISVTGRFQVSTEKQG